MMQSTESNFKEEESKECKEHYKAHHEKDLGHRLVLDRSNHNRYRFTFLCKQCRTKVVSGFCSRAEGRDNYFLITTYGVEKEHWNHVLMKWCKPNITNQQTKTIKELSVSPELNVLVNDTLGGKKYRGISTKAKQVLLVNAGCGNVSLSAIKSAVALIKVTPFEHITSYKHIMPYYEQWKILNPKLAYDLEPKGGGVFHRLVVVLPYTAEFLPNMLNVFGLDAGFMPKVPLKGKYFVYFCLCLFSILIFHFCILRCFT